jgi:isocitrate dehydrogenase kinase/phosphatase
MSADAHYRQLLDLSQRMLAAGMAQHWDELVQLEQQRRALLDKSPALTKADMRQPLIELIRQIQTCDAELREKIDSWMNDARILLRLDTQHSPTP